jgi:ABC-type dipeptide/oligopeptide/nickel transport system ATPase component
MRPFRGRVASLIPQTPAAALNPALRIGTQLREAWRAHSRAAWTSQWDRILELMESAGLPADPDFLRRYPSQISAGQAQRIMIVMALLHSPALLIADEPTSALDLITQHDVLDLLARINREQRMAILFISHDLMAVAALCHRLAILHEGAIVESGPVNDVLDAPAHPYTRQLIEALPKWKGSASPA